mmetsp:Transcript_102443/g.161699  ORF Transcript_102443/g.161699 Transcript_102443/m.161699 type:complete len:167 (+) Transcript_102443:3-503(+)
MVWLPDHIWAKQQKGKGSSKGNWLPDHIWLKQKQQRTGKGNWLPDHIWEKQKQQKSGKGGWLPDHIWLAQKKGKGGGKTGKGKRQQINAQRTVWVGSIPEGTTHKELKEHVDSICPCKWTEVHTGKSKGSGLIGFATEEETASAITMLNGSVLKGVAIEVDTYTKK